MHNKRPQKIFSAARWLSDLILHGLYRGICFSFRLLHYRKVFIQTRFFECGDHFCKGSKIAVHGICLQRFKVFQSAFFGDGYRQETSGHELVVHEHPGGAAVAVHKRMNFYELRMRPRRQFNGI